MTKLREFTALALRAPIATPVRTSFGVMRTRPMILVRVQDTDGAEGWGEVWCNFPDVGVEHRVRLLESVVAPLLTGDVGDPPAVFERLSRQTRVLAIQTGEPGPLAQCNSGLDIALWDLKARKAGLPLYRLLGGSQPHLSVYASGLNPEEPERLARSAYEDGYRAFKLKVGFGLGRDAGNLHAMRDALPAECAVMVDANQAWSLEQSLEAVEAFAGFALEWLEEPMAADAPASDWKTLASKSAIPLAAGENLTSPKQFAAAISAGVSVLQPDITKWGGLSACVPIARDALSAGKRFCPHFLGGAIGLAASAHFLAAVGGDGRLEIDANENPLRSLWPGPLQRVRDGRCTLDERPGISIEPSLRDTSRYCVAEVVVRY